MEGCYALRPRLTSAGLAAGSRSRAEHQATHPAETRRAEAAAELVVDALLDALDADGAAEQCCWPGLAAIKALPRKAGRVWVIQKATAAMAAANPQSLKQYLHALADELPKTATTKAALYHLELRRDIEAGLDDCEASRTVPIEELMQRLQKQECSIASARLFRSPRLRYKWQQLCVPLIDAGPTLLALASD